MSEIITYDHRLNDNKLIIMKSMHRINEYPTAELCFVAQMPVVHELNLSLNSLDCGHVM